MLGRGTMVGWGKGGLDTLSRRIEGTRAVRGNGGGIPIKGSKGKGKRILN